MIGAVRDVTEEVSRARGRRFGFGSSSFLLLVTSAILVVTRSYLS